MENNNLNLPNHYFITNGRVDPSKVAKVQRMSTPKGSDVYVRYIKYWRDTERKGTKTEPKRVVGNESDVVMGNMEESGDVNIRSGVANNRSIQESDVLYESASYERNYTGNYIESNEVWIGIKFDEEDVNYTLQDMYGSSINRSDYMKIRHNKERYAEFEFKCWSDFIEKDISTYEELFREIACLLNVAEDKVLGARVDSQYDENLGDVIISFKARVEKGAWG